MSGTDLGHFLDDLYALLEARKRELPDDSYTAKLFTEGDDVILRKIAEETTEVLLAAKGGAVGAAEAAGVDPSKLARDQLVWEVSDLLFHMLVLMVQKGISLEDVHAELVRRHGR